MSPIGVGADRDTVGRTSAARLGISASGRKGNHPGIGGRIEAAQHAKTRQRRSRTALRRREIVRIEHEHTAVAAEVSKSVPADRIPSSNVDNPLLELGQCRGYVPLLQQFGNYFYAPHWRAD